MSEQEVKAPKPAKKEVTYTTIEMEDGRKVSFPGDRRVSKSVTFDTDTNVVTLRIDVRNGKTYTLRSDELAVETNLQALGHGLSQKVGDEWASVKELDDISLTAEAIIKQLKEVGWAAQREAGDSMSGASVVIRAIAELKSTTVEKVKAFLQGKLDAAKAKGEKLSRQELYASFRKPGSKTYAIIQRLEAEKAGNKVDSDDLLEEMEAAEA